MILFPNDDTLTQGIESWKDFANALHGEDTDLFLQTLNGCYQYSIAIDAKGEYYSAESLIMGLVFVQRKIINLLINKADPSQE